VLSVSLWFASRFCIHPCSSVVSLSSVRLCVRSSSVSGFRFICGWKTGRLDGWREEDAVKSFRVRCGSAVGVLGGLATLRDIRLRAASREEAGEEAHHGDRESARRREKRGVRCQVLGAGGLRRTLGLGFRVRGYGFQVSSCGVQKSGQGDGVGKPRASSREQGGEEAHHGDTEAREESNKLQASSYKPQAGSGKKKDSSRSLEMATSEVCVIPCGSVAEEGFSPRRHPPSRGYGGQAEGTEN